MDIAVEFVLFFLIIKDADKQKAGFYPCHTIIKKKIAVINDFSGFGRCSIAVALPIISAMKIQCCPIPTSIFSNHTGFESFVWTDFTDQMQPYMDEWAKLDLKFQAICTGFLGSARQIELVKGFLRRFKTKETLAVIDPVMGDYGKLYPTYAEELALKMVELLPYADILNAQFDRSVHFDADALPRRLFARRTRSPLRTALLDGTVPRGDFGTADFGYPHRQTTSGSGENIRS